MAVRNAVKDVPKMLNAFRQTLDGTEYEGLIPEAMSSNIREWGDTLFNYPPVKNRFVEQLVNVISFAKVSKMYFTNPFGFSKRGTIPYGYTIEDIWVDIAQAHSYGEDTDPWAMLKKEKPNIVVAYHTRNREDFFKQTIWEKDLRAAFYSAEGVSSLVDRVINGMYTSNDVAEFAYSLALISEVQTHGMMSAVSVTEPTNEETAKEMLTAIKNASNNLLFPSRKYNAAGVMNTTSREDQMLFITPKADAVVSVQALAYAFNMSEADFLGRKMLIPEIPGHPEILAIIADKEWLNIYDNLFESRDFEDRENLCWTYWLHIWQTYFISPWHNCVAIITGPVPTINTVTVTGPATYTPGGAQMYTATVTGLNNPPQSVIWAVTGNTSQSTSINDRGLLTLGMEEKGNLTVHATPYLDKSKSGSLAVNPA